LIGGTIHFKNKYLDKLNVKLKMQGLSHIKNGVENYSEIIKCMIEKEKINKENEILNRKINFYNEEETKTKNSYNNEKNNYNDIEKELQEQYKNLDEYSTKLAMLDLISTTKINKIKKYTSNFMIGTILGGLINTMFFCNRYMPVETLSSIFIFSGLLSGAVVSLITIKSDNDMIKALRKINLELGEIGIKDLEKIKDLEVEKKKYNDLILELSNNILHNQLILEELRFTPKKDFIDSDTKKEVEEKLSNDENLESSIIDFDNDGVTKTKTKVLRIDKDRK